MFCLEHNTTEGQPCITQVFPFAASPLNLSPVFLLYNLYHLFSFFGLESPTLLPAASHHSTYAHIQSPVSCLSICSALQMKAEDSAETFYPVHNTTMHHVSSHSALPELHCRIWVTTDWKEVELHSLHDLK